MTKFQNGHEKIGGRTKGTKNKLNLGVSQALNTRGIDCVNEMLNIAKNTDKEEIKLAVYKELLKYIYPQCKAVEIANDVKLPLIKIEGIKI